MEPKDYVKPANDIINLLSDAGASFNEGFSILALSLAGLINAGTSDKREKERVLENFRERVELFLGSTQINRKQS